MLYMRAMGIFPISYLERTKEHCGMTMVSTSHERETPPRDGDLFSFCALLYQQFGTAAQLNGFARTQSSITVLTEGEKDITLID